MGLSLCKVCRDSAIEERAERVKNKNDSDHRRKYGICARLGEQDQTVGPPPGHVAENDEGVPALRVDVSSADPPRDGETGQGPEGGAEGDVDGTRAGGKFREGRPGQQRGNES